MFFQQGALNVPEIPRFFFMFSLPVLKANQPKTVVFTVLWQDNMQKKHKKNDVLEQFFAFFQLVLVK